MSKRNFQNSITIQGFIGQSFVNQYNDENSVTKSEMVVPRTDSKGYAKTPLKINLAAFNGVGKALSKTTAGDHLIIFGSLNSSTYTPEGQEKEITRMEVIVSKFEVVETNKERQERKEPAPAEPKKVAPKPKAKRATRSSKKKAATAKK